MFCALMQNTDYFDPCPLVAIIYIVPLDTELAISAANIADWTANAGKGDDPINVIGNRNQIGFGL